MKSKFFMEFVLIFVCFFFSANPHWACDHCSMIEVHQYNVNTAPSKLDVAILLFLFSIDKCIKIKTLITSLISKLHPPKPFQFKPFEIWTCVPNLVEICLAVLEISGIQTDRHTHRHTDMAKPLTHVWHVS